MYSLRQGQLSGHNQVSGILLKTIFQLQTLKQAQSDYDKAKREVLKGISRIMMAWIAVNCLLLVASNCLEGLVGDKIFLEQIGEDQTEKQKCVLLSDVCPAMQRVTSQISNSTLSYTQIPPKNPSVNCLFNSFNLIMINIIYPIMTFLITLINLIRFYSVFVAYIYVRYWEWERLSITKRNYEDQTSNQVGRFQELRRLTIWVIWGEQIKRIIIAKCQNLFLTSKKSI